MKHTIFEETTASKLTSCAEARFLIHSSVEYKKWKRNGSFECLISHVFLMKMMVMPRNVIIVYIHWKSNVGQNHLRRNWNVPRGSTKYVIKNANALLTLLSLSLPTWNAIKPGFSLFSVTSQNNVSLSIPQSNSTDFTKVYIIRISEDMRSPNNLFSNVSCRSSITHTASSECVHKQTFSASSFIWSKKDFPLEIRLSGHSGLLLRSVDPIEVQIRTLYCVCR